MVPGTPWFHQPDIDAAAVNDRYISITPIKCDLTDYDALRELGGWDIEVELMKKDLGILKDVEYSEPYSETRVPLDA